MQRKARDGVTWLEFDLLADQPRVKHGVFLRHGGQSTNPAFATLNLGDNVGDEPIIVAKNRKIACDHLGLERYVSGRQCHGVAIQEVKQKNETLQECDILATAEPDVGLLIAHADCQAAIIYDPVEHVVVNVHAGWRGSVQNIYAKAIAFMQTTYGSLPANLLVCIGPSLGPSDAQFVNYEKELPKAFWKYQVKPFYFDFWAISRMQLLQCGVLSHHIEIARINTFSNEQDYFSYRRQNITGRHGTIVALV